jgi:PadR family transcriptional regulator, regulatory protein PadR
MAGPRAQPDLAKEQLFYNTVLKIVFLNYHPYMAKKPEYRGLFPGALELMILQTLDRKPMHGYALAQHIKAVSDDLLQIEEGSLYPALQRMLKTGWLESEMGLSAKNRPVRIFKVTKAGGKHLAEERSSFEQMFAGITRVLEVAQS